MNNDFKLKLDEWRRRIDEIDLKLLDLLNERSRCAIEIGKVKALLNIEIYDPRREKEVIGNVQSAAGGPLTKDAVRRLFERIIDESRRAEREDRNSPAKLRGKGRNKKASSSVRRK